MRDILVGRRAVYTQVTSKWDDTKQQYVELSRAAFRGVIAALLPNGSIVMLYDDGSMRAHDMNNITVEADQTQGPYR